MTPAARDVSARRRRRVISRGIDEWRRRLCDASMTNIACLPALSRYRSCCSSYRAASAALTERLNGKPCTCVLHTHRLRSAASAAKALARKSTHKRCQCWRWRRADANWWVELMWLCRREGVRADELSGCSWQLLLRAAAAAASDRSSSRFEDVMQSCCCF